MGSLHNSSIIKLNKIFFGVIITLIIPETSKQFGFVTTGMGAHTGRTMMFRDLCALMSGSTPENSLQDYHNAVLTENILLKPTGSARYEGFRRLKQLYGLDQRITVFRSLRLLWEQDPEAQPMLALLCAVARDPLLRATVGTVISLQEGMTMTAPVFAQIIRDQFPDRLTETTLASIGRNIASSWVQSGHFTGNSEKTRKLIQSCPIVTAYALFLAYLCDVRGDALFDTPWSSLLDTPKHILYEQAQQASQQGWLEYRHSGTITDITFRHLLRDQV
jgi:hypothetical protein